LRLDFRVDFDDVLDFRSWLDELVASQIPFATALALTRTARDARQALKDGLPSHFTIRTKFTASRLRFEPATKRNPVAYVGHLADYMRLQAEGGDKPSAGTLLGVPTAKLRSEAPKGVVRARGKYSPKRLLTKKRRREGYFVKALSASGSVGLFRKIGESHASSRLELLYVLAPRVRVDERWPFLETVEATVAERWEPNAKKALERAVRSARRRRR
jgi:hypothetical protein